MMSGSGILTNGKGTRREYGEFNLDELQVVSSVFYVCMYLCTPVPGLVIFVYLSHLWIFVIQLQYNLSCVEIVTYPNKET